jgi:hypothetical protein
MLATIDWGRRHPAGLQLQTQWGATSLEEAYRRCGIITADYAKTFYLVREGSRSVWGVRSARAELLQSACNPWSSGGTLRSAWQDCRNPHATSGVSWGT